MNYFGHAAIARRASGAASPSYSGSAGFALGAMLPDFASMCGARIDDSADAQIAAGIAFHHRTDAIFHHLPPVLALMRELEERLRSAGCSRGPTRAVSHLGVELLLDGVLVADEQDRQLYSGALAHAAEAAATLRWREPEHPERFAHLLGRLSHYGPPDDLRATSSVTERLLRIISRRPLLAPQGNDASLIASALAAYQARVVVAAPTVMRGVLAALAQEVPEAPEADDASA